MLWGMTDYKASEPLRPEFMTSSAVARERSVVTGRPAYVPDRTTNSCRRGCAGTVVGTFLGIVIVLVGSIFILRVWLNDHDTDHGGTIIPAGWGSYISAIINAVQIQILDVVYGYLARALTDWENHPTATRHTNSLIVKLAVFRGINSYFSLLYIAAIKGHVYILGELQTCALNSSGVPDCMLELQSQLAILLITRFILNIFSNVGWPLLVQRVMVPCHNRCCMRSALQRAKLREVMAATSFTEQSSSLPADSVFDAYLDVIITLGYVSLFVAAFPLAPAFALAFQLVTNKVEVYRLLHLSARPFPRGAQDIGAWEKVFELLSYLSTVSNLAIVVFTNTRPLFGTEWSSSSRLAFFIAAEHGVLAIKWLLERYIPDHGYAVRVQLERKAYLVQKHIFGVDLAGTLTTLGGQDVQDDDDGVPDTDATPTPVAIGAGTSATDFYIASSYEDMQGARFRGHASTHLPTVASHAL